jgi:hypothetical protein
MLKVGPPRPPQDLMFNPIQAFLLVQKLKSSPRGFIILGVKAEIEKRSFSICPKLLINVVHYGPCIGPKAGKRIRSNLGGKFVTPGGQCLSIY